MKLIVMLRQPIDRMVSAYTNKLADSTMHKHLDEHLFRGTVDNRLDDSLRNYRAPSIRDLAIRINTTLFRCPDFSMHYTLAERPGKMSGRACYVNPFVLHGYYAKYLRPWVRFIVEIA
jgi:hypothetical protein